MPTFATPGPIAATVEVAGAQVRVTASDQTDTVVLVEPINECDLHMASGRVQLDRINALQANIASGEVAIGHIVGRATIEGAAFAMRIGEVQDAVKLPGSGGQTWIGHASADVDLSSGSGGFDIDRADGNVTAKTGNGAIRIGRFTRGQAELMNGSGNIEVGMSEGTAAIRRTPKSRSTPARGTATSSSNAQQVNVTKRA